eukprot:GHRR01009973.1.p1 GENE.GHRR01009973.1~~GHRR01009973.1.p1  ORF type:complete len:234 (+),score=80.09 GHRR01009973.1:211-912(+)
MRVNGTCLCHTAFRAGHQRIFAGSGLSRRCSRQNIATAALPSFAALLAGLQGSHRSAVRELLRVLTAQQAGSDDSQQVQQLLNVLLSCEGVRFNEQLLAGGPWRVLYTQGDLQLWKATYKAGKVFNARNAASQDLNPSNRTVVNKAEYYGNALFVTASGTYEPLGTSATLPQRVRADITSGSLHIAGLDIPLPIRGTGEFNVVYLDDKLRVFESAGAISVQVRESYLTTVGML